MSHIDFCKNTLELFKKADNNIKVQIYISFVKEFIQPMYNQFTKEEKEVINNTRLEMLEAL